MKTLECVCAVSENVKWYSYGGKIKDRIDPAIPLLGIDPKEWKAGSRRDISTSMFVEALFAVAKRWKPSKCLLMEE